MSLLTPRFKFKVTRIIDADTICGKIDLPFGIEVERTVRVAGIDCPEIRRCSEVVKQLGLEALGYVSQWLRFAEDNVFITIEPKYMDRTDSFGRIIANVEYSGLDLGNSLRRQGLAVDYGTGFNWGSHANDLL